MNLMFDREKIINTTYPTLNRIQFFSIWSFDIGDQFFPIGLDEIRKPRPGRVDPIIAQAFNMIELLPSSGIFVYPKHIREVEHKGSGKKIARYLLSCFYTSSELVAAGNLTGANFKKGLDPGIVETIVGYCLFVDPNVGTRKVHLGWKNYDIR
ncbi:hypothetical protein KUTeg_023131 [Tegillarca granosa]|uniref:Uncharacterized protein n=1 Tax=Tegillarca granosa TaxID=220873 RepID=A0ABQ9E3U3_TEGGR|nr:hypothetical protein KUTeg_023131 [Tegillarca granosa]